MYEENGDDFIKFKNILVEFNVLFFEFVYLYIFCW